MKTGLFNFRHHARIGPGGWKCPCCRIAKSARRAESKALRRRMTRMLDKMETPPRESQ